MRTAPWRASPASLRGRTHQERCRPGVADPPPHFCSPRADSGTFHLFQWVMFSFFRSLSSLSHYFKELSLKMPFPWSNLPVTSSLHGPACNTPQVGCARARVCVRMCVEQVLVIYFLPSLTCSLHCRRTLFQFLEFLRWLVLSGEPHLVILFCSTGWSASWLPAVCCGPGWVPCPSTGHLPLLAIRTEFDFSFISIYRLCQHRQEYFLELIPDSVQIRAGKPSPSPIWTVYLEIFLGILSSTASCFQASESLKVWIGPCGFPNLYGRFLRSCQFSAQRKLVTCSSTSIFWAPTPCQGSCHQRADILL